MFIDAMLTTCSATNIMSINNSEGTGGFTGLSAKPTTSALLRRSGFTHSAQQEPATDRLQRLNLSDIEIK
jgi:hypothetical protein